MSGMSRGPLLAVLGPAMALTLWLGLGAGGLWLSLSPEERAGVGPVLAGRGAFGFAWWLAGTALAGWCGARLHARHVAAAHRLAGQVRALAGGPAAPAAVPGSGAALVEIATAANLIADERGALELEMARRVGQASARVAEQRDQLATLVAELQQAVVVCNAEGRILLYNSRAVTIFGPALVGLGRAIDAAIDGAALDHAAEAAAARAARGEPASARFVTATADGRLVQVGLAPVRHDGALTTGSVLFLEDITEAEQGQGRRDRELLALTETGRASVANVQAALDLLDYPDLEPAERARFEAVVRDEVAAMGARLSAAGAAASAVLRSRWPLQEMRGVDLVAAAARRLETLGSPAVSEAGEATADLWLAVDSVGLLQALGHLARRLAGAGCGPLALRLAPAPGGAHLDIAWAGAGPPPETLSGWQTEAMAGSPLSVRDIVERHGGELWLGQADEASPGAGAHVRILLPVAIPAVPAAAAETRPTYYDFDLFAASEAQRDRDSTPLSTLAFTVFDTETTGLDPAGGDEILQIGATRIVNGRLLEGERFDALIDPGRSIPEAGIAIHGITPAMVRGCPPATVVLPAFRAFVADTVLVGHNVAFDLSFLTRKQAATGVTFDMPVLDTLILAGLVHPGETSHGLDETARRLGLPATTARHTALGDALATAGILVRLIPLLAQRGIVTLGDARAEAERSWYARLRY